MSAPAGTKHLLVVDDDELIRRRYLRLIEEAGYQVTLAKSGQEAFNLFRSQHFDGIVLDVNMSGMDGIEAFDWMEENALETGDLLPPVLFVSAEPVPEDAIPTARAQSHLEKPFEPEALVQALAELTQPSW